MPCNGRVALRDVDGSQRTAQPRAPDTLPGSLADHRSPQSIHLTEKRSAEKSGKPRAMANQPRPRSATGSCPPCAEPTRAESPASKQKASLRLCDTLGREVRTVGQRILEGKRCRLDSLASLVRHVYCIQLRVPERLLFVPSKDCF